MRTDENKQVMAQNIRRYMDAKGITNQQLCADLGFKYTTFMDWIKAVTYPRIGKVEAMANYFGCEKSDLIEDKTIESHPVEMAERHFEMIMDEDLNEIYDYLRLMDAGQRRFAKKMIRSIIETETEA